MLFERFHDQHLLYYATEIAHEPIHYVGYLPLYGAVVVFSLYPNRPLPLHIGLCA